MEHKNNRVKSRIKAWSSQSLLSIITVRQTTKLEQNINSHYRRSSQYFPSAELMRKHIQNMQAYVFIPDHFLRFIWNMTSFLQILILSFLIPFLISFQRESFSVWRPFILFSDYFFLLDILLIFNTGYYESGVFITQRYFILRNYLKSLFFTDLLAAIPYYQISKAFSVSDTQYYQESLLHLLELLHLLRLLKYRKFIYQIQQKISSPSIIVILQSFNFLLIAFILVHWLACLQNYEFQISIQNEFMKGKNSQEYLWYLYLSVLTMTSVGYETITQKTSQQYIISIIAMMITSVIFGQILGGIQNVLQKFTANQRHFAYLLADCQKLKKRYKISESLFLKIYCYIKYLKEKTKENLIEQSKILQQLSLPINQEIFNYTRVHILKNISYFSQFSSSFLRLIGCHLTVKFYAPQDKVFLQNDVPLQMFFIIEGTVNIYHQQTGTIYKQLIKQGKFGQIGFFTGSKRTASAESNSFSQILTIDRFIFLEILQTRPKQKEITDLIVVSFNLYGNNIFGIKCYLCHSVLHIAKDCVRFVYILNKKDLITKAKNKKNKVGKDFSTNLVCGRQKLNCEQRLKNYSRYNVTQGQFNYKTAYPHRLSMVMQINEFQKKKKIMRSVSRLYKIKEEEQEEDYSEDENYQKIMRDTKFSILESTNNVMVDDIN